MSALLSTTVGKKFVVAVTGVILYGFVILHMLGNLKAFMGVDPQTGQYALDHYAEFLREMGAAMLGHGTVLWITRIVLLVALILHVGLIVALTVQNKMARPQGYAKQHYDSSTSASRTMLFSGVALLLFIIFHLLHMTTGDLHPNFIVGEVFHNVSIAFSALPMVTIYFVAMILLAFHLYHGVWSLFQTLGVTNAHNNHHFKLLAKGSAFVLFFGFVAVPLAIYFSVIK